MVGKLTDSLLPYPWQCSVVSFLSFEAWVGSFGIFVGLLGLFSSFVEHKVLIGAPISAQHIMCAGAFSVDERAIGSIRCNVYTMQLAFS
eukprot:SAG31_NODE_84_length_27014_cov_3.743006_4_plen_89_part_00